jgi:hypothetical protein
MRIYTLLYVVASIETAVDDSSVCLLAEQPGRVHLFASVVDHNEGAAISEKWRVEIGCFSASTLIKTWVLGQQMVWVWWG